MDQRASTDQLDLFRQPAAEPRVYECSCGGRWSQVAGTDPQTHWQGCLNAKPGDVILPRSQLGELPGETFRDLFPKEAA